MVKDIHNGIQNIKPVLDNQFTVRHTSKGKRGWQWRGNSKPRGLTWPKGRGFPPDSNPQTSFTEHKGTDHMTHWASLTPAFKFCISKLVSELGMCPTRLAPFREEIDTLWVEGQRTGKPATACGAGPCQPQHLPLQCVTQFTQITSFELNLHKPETRQWLSP